MIHPGKCSSVANGRKCRRRTVVAYFGRVYFITKLMVISKLYEILLPCLSNTNVNIFTRIISLFICF